MSTKKNWIKLTIAIAGALMLIGVSGAQAFTILQEDGVVYKILGLEVQGQALPFNVDFLVGTANNIYGGTFDFSPGEVSFAVDAVNEALNSRTVPANSIWESVGEKGEPGYGFYGIGTDVKSVEAIDHTLYLGGYVLGSDSGGQWVEAVKGTAFEGLIDSDANWIWAKFTPVPIPAAVWLLGGGLIGLIGLRRRFKN